MSAAGHQTRACACAGAAPGCDGGPAGAGGSLKCHVCCRCITPPATNPESHDEPQVLHAVKAWLGKVATPASHACCGCIVPYTLNPLPCSEPCAAAQVLYQDAVKARLGQEARARAEAGAGAGAAPYSVAQAERLAADFQRLGLAAGGLPYLPFLRRLITGARLPRYLRTRVSSSAGSG